VWFRRKAPPDRLDEDELVQSLGLQLIGEIGQLRQQVATLEHEHRLSSGERVDALKLSKHVTGLESLLKTLIAQRDEDVARYTASLESVRGQITGGRAIPKAQREAAQIGERLLQAMQNPQLLQQIIQELQGMLPNGSGPTGHQSPV